MTVVSELAERDAFALFTRHGYSGVRLGGSNKGHDFRIDAAEQVLAEVKREALKTLRRGVPARRRDFLLGGARDGIVDPDVHVFVNTGTARPWTVYGPLPSPWMDVLALERHNHWLHAKPGRHGGFKRKVSERLVRAAEEILAARGIDLWDLVAVKHQGKLPVPESLLRLARLDAEARWDET
jgi:hypothetical protein